MSRCKDPIKEKREPIGSPVMAYFFQFVLMMVRGAVPESSSRIV